MHLTSINTEKEKKKKLNFPEKNKTFKHKAT